jgi:hypothetical protein
MSSAYDDLEQRYNWTGQTEGKGTTNYQSSAEKDCGLFFRKLDLIKAEKIITTGKLKMVVANLKRMYPHATRYLPDEPTAEQLAPALLYHHRHFNKVAEIKLRREVAERARPNDDPPCVLTG